MSPFFFSFGILWWIFSEFSLSQLLWHSSIPSQLWKNFLLISFYTHCCTQSRFSTLYKLSLSITFGYSFSIFCTVSHFLHSFLIFCKVPRFFAQFLIFGHILNFFEKFLAFLHNFSFLDIFSFFCTVSKFFAKLLIFCTVS